MLLGKIQEKVVDVNGEGTMVWEGTENGLFSTSFGH